MSRAMSRASRSSRHPSCRGQTSVSTVMKTFIVRLGWVQRSAQDSAGAWFELEKSFAAENANYERIRIEPTTYNGYRAGIWEFTYTSGGAQLHVVDLGFITPRYGFALYFQTRAGDWDRMQPTFQAFKDSFKAPA